MKVDGPCETTKRERECVKEKITARLTDGLNKVELNLNPSQNEISQEAERIIKTNMSQKDFQEAIKCNHELVPEILKLKPGYAYMFPMPYQNYNETDLYWKELYEAMPAGDPPF